MRIEWPSPLPSYLSPMPADLPKGEVVHHTLWEKCGDASKVCIGENLPASDVVKAVSVGNAKSVIQFNADWFLCDLKMSLQLRQNADAYFLRPGHQLLDGTDQSWTWNFSRREEKLALKDRVLFAAGGTESAKESLALIFEELFMNAMIDAPREAQKNGAAVSQLPSTMVLTKRGNRVCLSCTDPYGTLKIPKFVGRMNEVYSEGAGKVINLQSDRGGAGLGCVLLFEHSSILALGVDPSRRTVVSCVVPSLLNHRQKESIQKSLHWIELAGQTGQGSKHE